MSQRAAELNLWIEVDAEALASNIRALRQHVGDGVIVAPVVKSNGYGHGLEIAARAFLAGGAGMLCVHSFGEAMRVRALDPAVEILILGPLAPAEIAPAIQAGLQLSVATEEALARILEGGPARVHLKVETGTNRQGMGLEELGRCLDQLRDIGLAGISSHFANIEDTTRHRFAMSQRERFAQALELCREKGLQPGRAHMASSAATILFPETHHNLVRPGIAAYGLWPSRETLASATSGGLAGLPLKSALRWCVVAREIKDVPAGEFIGYGCNYKVEVDSRIAVLPVGYADGYRRSLSGQAHVLIRGRRCPVRGRICMNLIMVDISHVPGLEAGEEAVLLGRQGEEEITAELLASWAGSIHYEIVAGISAELPRI